MSQIVRRRPKQSIISITVQIVGKLSSIFAAIAGLLLLVMAAHVTIDVGRRTLMNAPLAGTNEFITYWWMPMIVFLAIPLVEKNQSQLTVSLLTDSIDDKNRSLAVFWGRLFAILITIVVVYFAMESLGDSLESMQTSSGGFPVPIWVGKCIMVLGVGWLLVQMLVNMVSFYGIREDSELDKAVG